MASVACQKRVDPPGTDRAILQLQYFENGVLSETGNSPSSFSVWMQSQECHECPMVQTCVWNAATESSVQVLVDSRFGTKLALQKLDSSENLCEFDVHFDEHGLYNLTLNESNGSTSCRFDKISEPGNSFFPILYLFIFYVAMWISYYGVKAAVRYWRSHRTATEFDVSAEPENSDVAMVSPNETKSTAERSKKARLRSLDTFRGISIVIMIFVNLGGGGYWFFAHAPWNGLTVADLVFPWFMFIMGTSMYLSINGSIRKQVALRAIWLNVVRRSIILFLLGLFVNGFSGNDLRTLRILGVLQRFGITYFIVGTLLCIALSMRTVVDSGNLITSSLADLATLWIEWILIAFLVIAHTCITLLLPVPGCPSGYLGPGGLDDGGQYANCTGGAAGYVDRIVFSQYHMYNNPTCKEIYQTTVPYDPEGILGLLTASFTVFLGVQAGAIIVTFPSHRSRLIRLVLWGAILGLLGGILCAFSKEAGWIPVNKNLWSLSFVLVLASFAFIALSVLYYFIDVVHWWHGAPFYHAGMNSITLYLAHESFGQYLPFSWKPFTSPVSHAELLCMNVWASTLFVCLSVYLHHKRIFISI